MIIIFGVYFALLLFIAYLVFKKNEDLTIIERDHTAFGGINMLGVNSNDVVIPATCAKECKIHCLNNKECKGYSFYHPGQRCYIYYSGDFINDRPGYTSGLIL